MIGKRKEHDLEAAERALELAKRRLEIIEASYKQGVVPEIELLNETAAVQKASSGVDMENDQLAVWKELDKQLHDALKGVGLLDPATDKVEESEAVKDVEPTVEDGAQRHDLFYQIRISYSVSVWWKPVA
jgi:outer membrane protein TolC